MIARRGRRALGRQFGWLWAAYAVSAYGSGLGFGAFPIIAVLVLHADSAQVSALSAVGITAIPGREQPPQRTDMSRLRAGEVLDGWRHILNSPPTGSNTPRTSAPPAR